MSSRRKFPAATATLFLLGVTAPLFAFPALSEERTYEFDKINAVNIQTGLTVLINRSEQQSVTVTAASNWDFDHLKLSVEDGTLNASQTYEFWDFIFRGNIVEAFFRTNSRLTITLNVPAIEEIDAQSGATVQIANFIGDGLSIKASSGASVQAENLTYDDIDLDASSGGEIFANGFCARLEAGASSGADISAVSLSCTQAQARASSGATIRVFVTETLSAIASSGARVRVEGKPTQTDISSSSGGSVDVAD